MYKTVYTVHLLDIDNATVLDATQIDEKDPKLAVELFEEFGWANAREHKLRFLEEKEFIGELL